MSGAWQRERYARRLVALLEPRKYSERLGVIDPGQLFEVAGMLELGEVLAAEPMAGGLFGQNLALTTTEGRFVLRGNPHGHTQLTKERRVAEFIDGGSSLPAPWPYEVCDGTEIFGWTFAVMPLLPGEMGEAIRESADDAERVALATATGEALAMLHEAEADFFGPYDAQLDDFIEMDDFADWALHRFDHWRNACRSVNALSTEAELWLDELVEECAPALKEPFTPVLVHHDFKPGNLNFERVRDGFEPSGVFDLMEAYIADGEEDLVRMLWSVEPPERKAFVEAYTAHDPLRAGAAQRLALYAVCDWMVMWEYGRRHGIWFEDTTFMESVAPIVANARAVARDE
jgi:aminoglycoside phosphotransferase (APT) family kinase protein